MPVNELSHLVKRIERMVETGDKQSKSREEIEAELRMFRDELKSHVKGHFPTDDELKPLYDEGGKVALISKGGQEVDYQA